MVAFVLCPSGCRRSGGTAVVEGDEALDFSYVAKVEFRKGTSDNVVTLVNNIWRSEGERLFKGWTSFPFLNYIGGFSISHSLRFLI